jgi:hypothetical protein
METTHFYGPKAYHEFLRISASPSLRILKNTRILAGSENTRITYRDTLEAGVLKAFYCIIPLDLNP